MPRPELITAASSPALLATVLDDVARDHGGRSWCVVVSRVPLERDVTAALLARTGATAWTGPRVCTIQWLLDHYASGLDPQRTLTRLQVRQLVARAVLDLHAESEGRWYAGQVIGTRVSDATLQSLTRLFLELEPIGWTPHALADALAHSADGVSDGAPTPHRVDLTSDLGERLGVEPEVSVPVRGSTRAADRALLLAETYRRFQERVAAGQHVGPLGRAMAAAARATDEPTPFRVTKFCFIGFDGGGASDASMRMVEALTRRSDVEVVRVALVMPAQLAAGGWRYHGNDALYERCRDLGCVSRSTRDDHAVLAARYADRTELADLARGPFTFSHEALALAGRGSTRAEAADAHGPSLAASDATIGDGVRPAPATRVAPVPPAPVRGVLAPDPELEIETVAADIKRVLLARADLTPNDIAVVARRMDPYAADVVRALERRGVPAYASAEARLTTVPAVRAVLALFRLDAGEWRASDVCLVAESSYYALGLDAALLRRATRGSETPRTSADWLDRVNRYRDELAGSSPRSSATVEHRATTSASDAACALADGFARFVAQLSEALGRAGRHPADTMSSGAWVAALRQIVATWMSPERICGTTTNVAPSDRSEDALEDSPSPGDARAISTDVPRERRAALARADLDGINALTRAADEWLLGRELAGLADAPLDSRGWLEELDALTRATTIRATTYPRDAVHVLDAPTAAFRTWRHVYVIRLADGEFPLSPAFDEHALLDVERRVLRLPTSDERAARERLLFQLACATATERLTLSAPATDDRGKALVTSMFLTALPLRLPGFALQPLTARDLVPQNEEDLLEPADIDVLAAARCRPAIGAEGVLRSDVDVDNTAIDSAHDPLLAAWLTGVPAARVTGMWTVEEARARRLVSRPLAPTRAGAAQDAPDQWADAFTGALTPTSAPARLVAPTAALSPSELEVYARCHFRLFGSRALGLRESPDDDEQDEAAAFGTLQHAVLERLYGRLLGDGMLPPRSTADVEQALAALPDIAAAAVREYRATSPTELWDLDLAFVVDVLRQFVRRDLGAMIRTSRNDASPRVRTRVVALEVHVGGPEQPCEFDIDGLSFRLHGTIDRVEAIDDPRLPAKAQGTLLLVDYKTTRSVRPWDYKPAKYLAGERLQLPLYTAMAKQHFGRDVFGFTELHTSLAADPPPFLVRSVTPMPGGHLRLDKWCDEHADPVRAAADAALRRAAGLVAGMRRGDYAPQPDRECWGCSLGGVCRASKSGARDRRSTRAPMPLAVDVATYAAAQAEAARPRAGARA